MADKAFEKQLEELKKLAGVGSYGLTPYSPTQENFGAVANKLAQIKKIEK